jgi:DNA-binding FrmR family transcriptional regulator
MHDPVEKKKVLNRLSRIEGQVAALRRMVEDDRPCPQVLVQMAAVRGALARTGQVLLDQHVRTCVADALASGDPDARDTTLDELSELLARHGGLR